MNKKLSIAKKVLLFAGGIVATHGVGYAFDYVVYPLVTYHFGFIKSLIILFFLALILNYILVLLYDVMKKDLFGFEEIKKFQDDQNSKGLLRKILKMGSVPAFIALSFYDPFLATLYKRKGESFSGFKRRDYLNLILSTAIGCFLWSSIWSPILLLKKVL